MRTLILLSSTAVALAACAGDPATGADDYNAQMRRLADDCQARGGILAPTGQQTGQAARDNVCKINGEPSGRIRN